MRIILFFLIVVSTQVNACFKLPAHVNDSPALMVLKTKSIVIAKVTSFVEEKHLSTFSFSTVETLKGLPPDKFRLKGINQQGDQDDFEAHRKAEFWAGFAFNAISYPNCNHYGRFKVGSKYLIFLDGPTYPKGFELLASADDFWLEVIKTSINFLTEHR